MKKHRQQRPTPSDWPVPGTKAFARLFADLDEKMKKGELTAMQALREAQKRLMFMVTDALAKAPPRSDVEVEDLAQDLRIRLATSRAARRLRRRKGNPGSFMRGFARVLIHERTRRRAEPMMASIETIREPIVDGNQLDALVRREDEAELARALSQLSKGERRALADLCGPLPGLSCRVDHRHRTRHRHQRLINPEAVPRVVELLRR